MPGPGGSLLWIVSEAGMRLTFRDVRLQRQSEGWGMGERGMYLVGEYDGKSQGYRLAYISPVGGVWNPERPGVGGGTARSSAEGLLSWVGVTAWRPSGLLTAELKLCAEVERGLFGRMKAVVGTSRAAFPSDIWDSSMRIGKMDFNR